MSVSVYVVLNLNCRLIDGTERKQIFSGMHCSYEAD